MKIAVVSPSVKSLETIGGYLREDAAGHSIVLSEGGISRLRGVAEQQRPDVLVVEGMCRGVDELAPLEYVTMHYPQTLVVMLCSNHTPEFLINAMRAGIKEVLPAPATRDSLRAAIARMAAKQGQAAQPRPPGEVLAFIASKGGSGATFLATNLGYQLAERHSVLLIDLNLQFGDALAVLHDGKAPATIADVARDIDRLDASLLSTSAVTITPNYSVLAAPEDPAQALEIKPEHIQRILAVAAAEYEFVLLDMSRTIDPVSIAALDGAYRIFVVTQLGVPAIRNARQLLATFRSLGYPSEKTELIVNRFERSSAIDLDEVRKSLGKAVVRTVPNSYREVNSSIDQGTALVKVARANAVAKNIVELAESLKPRPQPGRSLIDRLLKRA